MDRSAGSGELRAIPRGVFVAVIGGVCLALALSAAYTFFTLRSLEIEYLENRAREIIGGIDIQARGPGRRNNPEFWRVLLEESVPLYGDSVPFVLLLNASGQVLASAGPQAADGAGLHSGIQTIRGAAIFVLDTPLMAPRQGMGGGSTQVSGWTLRLGLRTAGAEYLRRQAWIHLLVIAIAVATLAALSGYLLRTLERYLALQQKEASERHLRSLGTMAATLAHEIRNPLGAMKGLTQLVQEEIPETHSTQELMRTVVSEAERLERLVTDLLTFARPPQPRVETFDAGELTSMMRTLVDGRAASAGVSLVTKTDDGSLPVRSDPALLRQLLFNIVINAIDFSPPGSEVIVRTRLEQANRQLVIEVDDSGPGLSGQNPEQLFEPFQTTKTKGTGLGLTVSRQIAESLGGSVSLSDRPEGGARCIVRIPAER